MSSNDEIMIEKSNAKMLDICEECARVFYKPLVFTCPHCGGELIETDSRIAEVVIKLISLGFKISWAFVETYDDLNGEGPGTQIIIYFDDKYPDDLFNELPPEWFLSEYYIEQEENNSVRAFSALACNCCHDENLLDDENINLDIKITTSNMVTWLNDKDPEGIRAVLTLSGYQLGGNRVSDRKDEEMTLEKILDLIHKEDF